jgi:ligand-binding SRPBCC domain-containing protein
MKMYTFVRQQTIPAELGEVWNFFSSPTNLAVITPPKINFRILSNSSSGEMSTGQVITYKVTVLPLITMRWVTEITEVNKPYSFTDIQRSGPYSVWHHLHRFEEIAGGTLLTDEIQYAIPFGWIGRLAHAAFVERELNVIFEFRFQAVTKYFLNRKKS